MSCDTARDEIHVGDTGTKYRLRVLDNGADLDPTGALVTELTFKMPGLLAAGLPVSTLTKSATVEVGAGAELGQWFLSYTVTAADVSSAGFHSAPGQITLQGYLEWDINRKWSSDLVGTDTAGEDLWVYPNLA